MHRLGLTCLTHLTQFQKANSRSRALSGPSFTVSHLAEKKYWDERYKTRDARESHFDWLADSESTLEHVLPFVRPNSRILDLGCGTSSFALNLQKSSAVAVEVVCLDYSYSAVKTMKSIHNHDRSKSSLSSVHFIQADATKTPFKAGTFDVILDKGTTDSVLKFEDRRKAHLMAQRLQLEALRILSPLGVYLQITDEDPDLRTTLLGDLLKDRDVSVSHKLISGDYAWEYFMYVVSWNKVC